MRHAEDAFSGEGARRVKGRWHSVGTRVVYAAESTALAVLELVARVPRPLRMPEYAVIPCCFPKALVEEVDRTKLPANWYESPAPPELQRIGTAWADSLSSAVLAVPSAIVPTEINYLLNPEHPDFHSIDVGLPRPFRLDLRLLG